MNSTFLPHAARAALAGLACACLLACSDAASRPGGGSQVGVAVAASAAGVDLEQDTVAATITLRAVEIDGGGSELRWSGTTGIADGALWALRHCLDYGAAFRPQGRRAPPGWLEPGLVRAEALRCVHEAGLPPPAETTLPAAQAFDVWLGVNAPDLGRETGSPLWASGGALGGMRLVRKPGVDGLPTVTTDARACRDTARQGGAIDSYQTPAQGNSGDTLYLQTYMVSAEGLLRRFDQCMAQRGYALRPPKEAADGGDWQAPEID